MAVYKPIQIAKDRMDPKILMKSLYRHAEDLKFLFANLGEDNFSKEFLDHLQERSGRIREIKFQSDGLKIQFEDLEKETLARLELSQHKIDLLVQRGGVVKALKSRLELYGEKIVITGNRLKIDADNMKLDFLGNVEYSGKIIGGSINIANRFIVDSEGNAYYADGLNVNMLNPSDRATATELEVSSDEGYSSSVDGEIRAWEVYVAGRLTCRRVRFLSDQRVKEIGDQRIPAGRILEKLRPVSFRFRESGKPGIGFIAQEVLEIPDVEREGVKLADRKGTYFRIPYDSYGAVFSQAIQDNQLRLERLRKRIAEREKKRNGIL